jgi:NTP pyrophosphatase (non-canonical NTP hydrolase)
MSDEILKLILAELKSLKKGQEDLKKGQEELQEVVSAIRASQETMSAEMEGMRKEMQQNFAQVSRHMRMLESDLDLIGKRQFENEIQINRLKGLHEQ